MPAPTVTHLMCLEEVVRYGLLFADTLKQILLARHGQQVMVQDLSDEDLGLATGDAMRFRWGNTDALPDMPLHHSANWSQPIPPETGL